MQNDNFAEIVKNTRKLLGESQKKFGERWGVKQQAVFAWENGRNIADGKIIIEIVELAGRLKLPNGNPAQAFIDLTKWLAAMYPDAVGQKWGRRSTDKGKQPPAQLLLPDNSNQQCDALAISDSRETEIRAALGMCEHVLRSVSLYSNSLLMNIKAFHRAVSADDEIRTVRSEIADMKDMLKTIITSNKNNNEGTAN